MGGGLSLLPDMDALMESIGNIDTHVTIITAIIKRLMESSREI